MGPLSLASEILVNWIMNEELKCRCYPLSATYVKMVSHSFLPCIRFWYMGVKVSLPSAVYWIVQFDMHRVVKLMQKLSSSEQASLREQMLVWISVSWTGIVSIPPLMKIWLAICTLDTKCSVCVWVTVSCPNWSALFHYRYSFTSSFLFQDGMICSPGCSIVSSERVLSLHFSPLH